MSIRPILIDGDPLLRSTTRLVTAFDSRLEELVADMFDTMYAGGGVGLAANQVGSDLRVFVYDCLDADANWHKGAVVNPVLWTSSLPQRLPDPGTDTEGCMSVPLEEGYPVVRPEWAAVTGCDVDGSPLRVTGSGVLARCFQHECDHLNGQLYLDRLTGEFAAAARNMIVARGWGIPGNAWLPQLPEGESAPVSRKIMLRRGGERGPISMQSVEIPAGIELKRVT